MESEVFVCVYSVKCVVMECVVVFDGGFGAGEGHDFIFVGSEFHLPGVFPSF